MCRKIDFTKEDKIVFGLSAIGTLLFALMCLAAFSFFSSCTTAPIATTPEVVETTPPPSEVELPDLVLTPPIQGTKYKAEDFKIASPKFIWGKELVEALELYGQDLLKAEPIDAKTFCPTYPILTEKQRMGFWVMLLTKLVEYESNYDPKTSFFEKNVQDNPTSRGLFQMSIASGNGNYKCGIKKEIDLHDPKTNIICTVKAFNVLVPAGNKFNSPAKKVRLASYIGGVKVGGYWQGASAFWSPFRRTEQLNGIRAKTKEVCNGY